MSADPQDSVFLVTSSDSDNQQFGSAFAFYSDEDANEEGGATYFLTCRHVVTDVGGPDQVRIGGYPAKVVASGSEGSLEDLAVLRVDGLHDVPILRLNLAVETGIPVKILGFQSFVQSYLVRPLQAHLEGRVGLETRREPGRVVAWDLRVEGDYDLERGYSGGPVIDEKSGEVVAVANYRLGGRKGIAVSIETLEKIGSTIIDEIKASFRKRFWNSLIDETFPENFQPMDAAHLQLLEVSSRTRFSHIYYASLIRLLHYKSPAKVKSIRAMVDADGLSKGDVGALSNKLYTDRKEFGSLWLTDVYCLFLDGCPDELLPFLAEQAQTLMNRPVDEVGWGIRFWVFDLQERQVHKVVVNNRNRRRINFQIPPPLELGRKGRRHVKRADTAEDEPFLITFFERIGLQYPF